MRRDRSSKREFTRAGVVLTGPDHSHPFLDFWDSAVVPHTANRWEEPWDSLLDAVWDLRKDPSLDTNLRNVEIALENFIEGGGLDDLPSDVQDGLIDEYERLDSYYGLERVTASARISKRRRRREKAATYSLEEIADELVRAAGNYNYSPGIAHVSDVSTLRGLIEDYTDHLAEKAWDSALDANAMDQY